MRSWLIQISPYPLNTCWHNHPCWSSRTGRLTCSPASFRPPFDLPAQLCCIECFLLASNFCVFHRHSYQSHRALPSCKASNLDGFPRIHALERAMQHVIGAWFITLLTPVSNVHPWNLHKLFLLPSAAHGKEGMTLLCSLFGRNERCARVAKGYFSNKNAFPGCSRDSRGPVPNMLPAGGWKVTAYERPSRFQDCDKMTATTEPQVTFDVRRSVTNTIPLDDLLAHFFSFLSFLFFPPLHTE
jgi:hypothetical protein